MSLDFGVGVKYAIASLDEAMAYNGIRESDDLASQWFDLSPVPCPSLPLQELFEVDGRKGVVALVPRDPPRPLSRTRENGK